MCIRDRFNGVVVEGNKIQVSLLNPNTGSAKWEMCIRDSENGVLTVTLPKAEAVKPQQIAVS